MRLTADTTTCVASGQCAMLAPETFGQRADDGTVILLNSEPPADQRDTARQAALICPSGAIQIVEPD
ncbi:MAG TPA: ferredoxin [Actinophytocola sp.]|uniref:ferredoxin n=1 Tax=Actinophytocola sp. TaxID=1872138 RepID=UPI002DBBD24B|nr:ferredoxin [Actinophytocola sp.]HEU5473579.1 ferredoxin [Actinophytocola sp.]